MDVYAFTERGIYRPGETVHLTALLRDGQGREVPTLPLTMHLLGPDGKTLLTQVLQPQADGAYLHAIDLDRSLHTGTYTLTLGPDKDSVAGETSFTVDSFRPPRIGLELQGPDLIQEAASAQTASKYSPLSLHGRIL